MIAEESIGRARIAHCALYTNGQGCTQPLCARGMDGAVQTVLAINGEFYNHKRMMIDFPDFTSRSDCDSEACMYLLQKAVFEPAVADPRGELIHAKFDKVMAQLRGEFAVLVFDALRQVALLSRDSHGVK